MHVSTEFAIIGAVVVTLVAQWAINRLGKGKKQEEAKNVPKSKNNLHLLRRFQHAATGCIIYFISASGKLSKTQVSQTLGCCALGFFLVHLLRLRFPKVQQFLVDNFQHIARTEEINGKVPGSFYFLLGSFLSSWLFEQCIFHLSLLMLSLGDPAAGIAGTAYSSSKLLASKQSNQRGSQGGKTLVGSFAAFATCFLVTLFYLEFECTSDVLEHKILIASCCGLFGSLSERVELVNIDDNFSIPLLSGILMSVFFQVEQEGGKCLAFRF